MLFQVLLVLFIAATLLALSSLIDAAITACDAEGCSDLTKRLLGSIRLLLQIIAFPVGLLVITLSLMMFTLLSLLQGLTVFFLVLLTHPVGIVFLTAMIYIHFASKEV